MTHAPSAAPPRLAAVVRSEATLELARKKFVAAADGNLRPGSFVVTKGSFDLLHSGHLSLFAACSRIARNAPEQQSVLVVVESDASVRARKGESRPFQTSDVRALQVALCPNVDHVLVAGYAELPDILGALRPAAYVKGMDTAIQRVPDNQSETAELDSILNPELDQRIRPAKSS